MERQTDKRVLITVHDMPTYELPGSNTELLDTHPVPAMCITGTEPLGIRTGTFNLTIMPRYANYYSGNFFQA